MKKCNSCKELKPLTEYHKSDKKDGLNVNCKPCAIRIAKQWYQ